MNTRLEILDDHIYKLIFDRPASSANIFDRVAMDELEEQLQALSGDTQMRGLIMMSAKDSIFIAGADIRELLAEGLSTEEVRGLVRNGQRVFNRIAELRVPTVAAIHGACLGGGLELCLACDYRIASDDKSTKIGLPETQLGILPAWGGSTRLPRLIGLPKALDCILAGKRLAAKKALKYGIVSDVVPREVLVLKATSLINKGKPRIPSHALTNNSMVSKIIRHRVQGDLIKKTRGHYPAVLRALDVVTKGVSVSEKEALAMEEEATADLVKTDVCRQLVRIFFLQEKSKHLRAEDVQLNLPAFQKEQLQKIVNDSMGSNGAHLDTIAVIGAGVMGAGIAQWMSARGRSVILKDINEEQVSKGLATIAKIFKSAVKRHLFSKTEARQALDRIYPSVSNEGFMRTDMVIEAAVEDMEIKKKIFCQLDEICSSDAVLATNTSALSITELAKSTKHPERVIGIHFFNPVHKMQLVEIVVGEETSSSVIARSIKCIQRIGKLPVVVKDRPGFLVNRILMPYLIEAGHLFEQCGSVKLIDDAMLEFGMPMGPLRLIDEVGVDVSLHVAKFFSEAFGDRIQVPKILEAMMKAKALGKKSGLGFYTYQTKEKSLPVNEKISTFVTSARKNVSDLELQDRMVLVMVNEAARCLEEDVVSSPEDIDFGMIMGTGFAPFRGGVLRYADSVGVEQIVDKLNRLADAEGKRFTPCDRLVSMAKEKTPFYNKELVKSADSLSKSS